MTPYGSLASEILDKTHNGIWNFHFFRKRFSKKINNNKRGWLPRERVGVAPAGRIELTELIELIELKQQNAIFGNLRGPGGKFYGQAARLLEI